MFSSSNARTFPKEGLKRLTRATDERAYYFQIEAFNESGISPGSAMVESK